MDLWDTAGQEKFRSLLTLYYKNSDAVVIVFDVTEPSTFKTVDYWAKQIETHCEALPGKRWIMKLLFWLRIRSTFGGQTRGCLLRR